MAIIFHPYPHGSVPVNASAIATAAAQCQTSMPAVTGRTNYLAGVTVTSGPPSAGVVPLVALVTFTDGTWTLSFQFTETTSAGGWLREIYQMPLPATNPNTAITVTLAAVGNGGVSAISLEGYHI